MTIPFCKPYLDKAEIKSVNLALKSGWITTGRITEQLEEKIADFTGAKYCVMLNSCTSALHLSLEYLKRTKYGKDFIALVPSMTFAATAQAVAHAGGTILWGDVDNQMLLTPDVQTPYQIAMPVHLCGREAFTGYDVPNTNVSVVEDCAHLMYKDQCKDSNHLFCYSFYATKNLTMGEGGCICTNDEQAYNWFKQARHHGISKDAWKRYDGGNWKYEVEFMGWKYNPSDVLSAILLANFDKYMDIHAKRHRKVMLYNQLLGLNNKGLHLYPILVEERPRFMELMAEKGIQCSVHFLPLHKMQAFQHIDTLKEDLSNTEYIGQHLVSLPLYPTIKDKEIRYICQEILKSNLFIHKG